jgi:hypothetical protein
MALYRAYLLEKEHVWTAIDLACMDDIDAKRKAESLANSRDVELWQGDRKVAVLKFPGNSSPSLTDAQALTADTRITRSTRFFFGLQGARNIDDTLGLSFETDMAAFRAAQELAAVLSSTRPNLRGNTCVVVTRNVRNEVYYVSV